ncbi:MAG: hypothetical protein KVP17_000731 [Porospora cf. gigantea B]|uniref:uncharacterized protein n=1 Tax=Porospora cf. gigantea B TaxID=2853592 RepID=UPI003571B5B3|nr:MAG: hypothetical protein KVP17_000731 [Porospora cf. gigantea B]
MRCGLTEAERAAAEFDRQTRSGDDSTAPKDPYNPLVEAFDRRAYQDRKYEQNSRRSEHSHVGERPERASRWRHDRFDDHREVRRVRSDEPPLHDTRRGAWRSRAGGVYLPPPHEDERPRSRDPQRDSGIERLGEEPGYRRRRSRSRDRPQRRASPSYRLD